jgi:hypothetical protein
MLTAVSPTDDRIIILQWRSPYFIWRQIYIFKDHLTSKICIKKQLATAVHTFWDYFHSFFYKIFQAIFEKEDRSYAFNDRVRRLWLCVKYKRKLVWKYTCEIHCNDVKNGLKKICRKTINIISQEIIMSYVQLSCFPNISDVMVFDVMIAPW